MTIGDLLPGQRWDQEIVAELSAQALCRLVGKQPNDTIGNSYRYIDHYAKEAGLSPVTACLTVLERVEKVLGLILGNDMNETDIQTTRVGLTRTGVRDADQREAVGLGYSG